MQVAGNAHISFAPNQLAKGRGRDDEQDLGRT